MTLKTLLEYFLDHSREFPDHTIIQYKKQRGGDYVDVKWKELQEAVLSFACGLIEMGMQPGERLAILSFNRLEWIVADLGTMLGGGVDVPIYHTNTAEQTAYILEDSDSTFVVVEDQGQLAKVQTGMAELNNLRRIILIEGDPPQSDERVVCWSDFMEQVSRARKQHTTELEQGIGTIRPDDMATIVYTSGTTGPPKGCMISHRNIAFVLWSLHELFRIDPATNLSLMILPISHLYPRVSGYYFNISSRIPFAIAESLDTLGQDMQAVRPTYFTSVPRIFEKVYDRIAGASEKGSPLKRSLFRWAVRVGRERSRKLNEHAPLSPWLNIRFAIADKLVFSKIRDALGGRLSFAVSAGAPLSAEVGEFIHSIGVQVLEFYGLTETILGTMTTFEHCRYGTVGKPMAGVELKIAEDGEILIRGNNFLGYHKKPELTSEILKDGWCYTGDVGHWDDGGFLVITDRKKDLIITSGGKNIAPQDIENVMKRIPLVSMAMVYGDNKKYLTALITLDRAETEAYAKENSISYNSYAELTQHPAVRQLIEAGMDSVNSKLARYETIKRFIVLPRDFTQEDGGEITPTLKVKRKAVIEKYGRMLDELYDEK